MIVAFSSFPPDLFLDTRSARQCWDGFRLSLGVLRWVRMAGKVGFGQMDRVCLGTLGLGDDDSSITRTIRVFTSLW